jgi:protein HIRA/HIR1
LPNGLEIWQGKRLMGHELNVTHLEWSPDDQMIASASFDNTVRVWSAATGAMITRLDGHASYVRGVAWDPVGSYLYSQGDDGLRCWKIETWRQHAERTFEPPFGRCSEEVLYVHPRAIAFTPCHYCTCTIAWVSVLMAHLSRLSESPKRS